MPRLGNRCPPSTTTGRPAWRRGRRRRGDTGQHRRPRQQADRRGTAGIYQRAEQPQRLPQRRRRKTRRRRGGQPGAGQGHLPQQARVQLPAKLPEQPAGGGTGVSEIFFPKSKAIFPPPILFVKFNWESVSKLGANDFLSSLCSFLDFFKNHPFIRIVYFISEFLFLLQFFKGDPLR